MLFKHCFYIFNNVSFYPSLLSFPEIRKLQVPDLHEPPLRVAALWHNMHSFCQSVGARCCVYPLPRNPVRRGRKDRFAYSLTMVHFRKVMNRL